MLEFLRPYLGELLTAIIAGFGGWFFERKRKSAEVTTLKVDNSEHIVKMYKEALDDLDKRYDEKFKELDVEILSLRKNLNLWKGKYRTLKTEFDEYREKHRS